MHLWNSTSINALWFQYQGVAMKAFFDPFPVKEILVRFLSPSLIQRKSALGANYIFILLISSWVSSNNAPKLPFGITSGLLLLVYSNCYRAFQLYHPFLPCQRDYIWLQKKGSLPSLVYMPLLFGMQNHGIKNMASENEDLCVMLFFCLTFTNHGCL